LQEEQVICHTRIERICEACVLGPLRRPRDWHILASGRVDEFTLVARASCAAQSQSMEIWN